MERIAPAAAERRGVQRSHPLVCPPPFRALSGGLVLCCVSVVRSGGDQRGVRRLSATAMKWYSARPELLRRDDPSPGELEARPQGSGQDLIETFRGRVGRGQSAGPELPRSVLVPTASGCGHPQENTTSCCRNPSLGGPPAGAFTDRVAEWQEFSIGSGLSEHFAAQLQPLRAQRRHSGDGERPLRPGLSRTPATMNQRPGPCGATPGVVRQIPQCALLESGGSLGVLRQCRPSTTVQPNEARRAGADQSRRHFSNTGGDGRSATRLQAPDPPTHGRHKPARSSAHHVQTLEASAAGREPLGGDLEQRHQLLQDFSRLSANMACSARAALPLQAATSTARRARHHTPPPTAAVAACRPPAHRRGARSAADLGRDRPVHTRRRLLTLQAL